MKKALIPFSLLLTLILSFSMIGFALPSQQAPVPDPAQAMALPANAMAMAMEEYNLPFDPNNDTFYWTALAYYLVLSGADDHQAVETEDSWLLPASIVKDCARMLFPNVPMPQLPAALPGHLLEASENDSYHLAAGDVGVQKTTVFCQGMQLFLTWTDPDTAQVLRRFSAELVPSNGPDGYAIANMTLIE